MISKEAHLLAYLEEFITEERKERFTQILSQRTEHFTVAIEDIFQMHNASAVIRTCEVFGVQTAHMIEEKYGKRLDAKIAMGAEKWVTTVRYPHTQPCIEALRGQGYRIVATVPAPGATPLQEFDITPKSAFFFGTERDGLSQEVISQADECLTIPMVGFTESLNISVSVAIILQYVTAKLRASCIPWQLSPQEELLLRLQWTKNSIRSLTDVLSRYESLQ